MKPPLPKSRNEKAEAYLRVMLEIKARLKTISIMQNADWPLSLRLEVCYLQLRHICELVTVGSLIVQGDYSSQLGESYSPGPIFKMLEKKYERSFPQPTTITKTDTGTTFNLNSVPNAMSQSELTKLWGVSGDRLHRLKISKFFSSYDASSVATQMADVTLHVGKLVALLNCHCIPMHNPKTLVLVSLDGGDGNPLASFLEYEANGAITVRPYSAKGATDFF